MPVQTAPLPRRNRKTAPYFWEGACRIKPWDYLITAIIPHLNTPRELKYCIELLKLQSIKPFIIIIDTGSTEYNYKQIEKLRSEDCEVHAIRLNGVLHPSEFVTAALDLGFSICRTKYAYLTHSDVFVRRIDFLEYLVKLCGDSKLNKGQTAAVGYEITPRTCPKEYNIPCNWKGILGHTASMYYMPTMDDIGAGWSIRRLSQIYGVDCSRLVPGAVGWPDTEVLLGELLRKNNLKVKIIGREENGKRTVDENIDHCRSLSASKCYSQEHYTKAKKWVESALKEAKQRIAKWRLLATRRRFTNTGQAVEDGLIAQEGKKKGFTFIGGNPVY